MFFSGVSPLEKVKIKKSCGILILEKTENSLESVSIDPLLVNALSRVPLYRSNAKHQSCTQDHNLQYTPLNGSGDACLCVYFSCHIIPENDERTCAKVDQHF